jgi:hypothetical protein
MTEYTVRLVRMVRHDDRVVPQSGFYFGRDDHGEIKLTAHANQAKMMTEDCAKALIEKVKRRFPLSEIA